MVPAKELPHGRTRGKTSARGYDAAWRKLRAVKLAANPLCECDDCKATGATVAAQVVDHIIPIRQRPDLRLTWSNLRSMSKAHHDAHTAREQGFARSNKPRARRVDASGCPEGWGAEDGVGGVESLEKHRERPPAKLQKAKPQEIFV